MTEPISRELASAVAWLDLAQVQELARLLLAEDWTIAERRLLQWVPELAHDCDLTSPTWSDALMDELEWRLSPPDEDDPDLVATREIPDYARYAQLVE